MKIKSDREKVFKLKVFAEFFFIKDPCLEVCRKKLIDLQPEQIPEIQIEN